MTPEEMIAIGWLVYCMIAVMFVGIYGLLTKEDK